MNIESARRFLLSLPHVVETRQWGDNLLFWVGDKAIGGKMCAVVDLGAEGAAMGGHISYPAPRERFAELLEIEGITPAKYLAHLSWVSIHRWDVFRTAEWQNELRTAHALTLAKLPAKSHKILALPKKEQKRMIAEQKAKAT
jgi:predicted DNA-binding protein (MmcQ/YjbR family)